MRTRVFTLVLFLAVSAADVAMAMGLGAAQLKSGLGQPLNVIIPVLTDGKEEMLGACFALVPFSEADDGLPGLNKVKLALKDMTGAPYLLLTTQTVVNDPVVVITVEARCPGVIRRDYTLLLDMVDNLPSRIEIVSPPVSVTPSVSRSVVTRIPSSSIQTTQFGTPARSKLRHASTSKAPGTHSQPALSSVMPNLALRMSADLTWLPGQHPLFGEQLATLKRMHGKLSINAGGQSSDVDRLRDDMVATQQQLTQAKQELALLKAQMAKTAAPPPAIEPPLVVKSDSHWWQSGWLWVGFALLVLVIGYFLDRRRRAKDFSFAPVYDEVTDSEDDAEFVAAMPKISDTADLDSALDKDAISSYEQHLDLEFTVTKLPGHDLLTSKSARNELLQTEALSVSNLLRVTEEAEVFLGLGYIDRAIAVLTEDIADKPRNHPAVWFMLLGIYRQQGDHEAFNQAISGFQQRFNLIPPTWDSDPNATHDGEGMLAMPHIQAKIMSLWPNHECHYYLSELLYDDRHGSRQGFRLDIYRDIIWLKEILDILGKPETKIAEEVAADDSLDWNFNSPANGQ